MYVNFDCAITTLDGILNRTGKSVCIHLGVIEMSTKISDIHAGLPDAKEDISYNKQEFMDSFVIPPRLSIQSLISGHVCFIVGNKGLGKTATLRYLNQYLINRNSKTCSSFILFEQDFSSQQRTSLEKIAGLSVIKYGIQKDESLDTSDFSLIWRWHLYLTIIRDNKSGQIFYKDGNWKKFSGLITGIFKEGKQVTVSGGIDLELPENLPSFFSFIKPHISIDLPEFKLGKKEYSFAEAMDEAAGLFLILARSSVPYYIFIDELDVYYGDEKHYNRDLRLVYDLAIEVKKMNNIFQETSWENTKIFCTLRPEVIMAIDKTISGKSIKREIDGLDFTLSWASDANETYTSPIVELFLKRIEVAERRNGEGGGSEESRYRRWFPEKIEGKEPTEYIKSITWSRPRDVVRLLNAAIKMRGNETAFTSNVFQDLMREYSAGSLQEIRAELETSYSSEDIDNIFDCFLDLHERFRLEDFEERLNDADEDLNIVNVLSDLYRVGVIGQAAGNRVRWFYLGDQGYKKNIGNIVHKGLIFELCVISDSKETEEKREA